ncbi:MAG TPA: hypothetical protein VFK05_16735 [Polyangiaceae bacterium]|nr:hypothetical protein [Polyangiaceae bacterium]
MPRAFPMRRSYLSPTLVLAVLLASALGACSSNPSVGSGPGTGAGSPAAGGVTGNAGASGGSGNGDNLNVGEKGEGGAPTPGDITELTLQLSLEAESIVVHGAPVSVVAHAQFDDGSVPSNVIYSVNNTHLGSIGDDGVFEANGYAAGSLIITAQVGTQSVSANLQITVDITENPDNLSEAARAALVQGGVGGANGVGPDSKFRFLYPYDNTVFPRGLLAPTLQFASSGAAATSLRLTTDGFSYTAFANAGSPTRIAIPEPVWRGLTSSAGAASAVKVSVSELVAGVATGPVEQQWSIAQGSLKGAIYYNTYRSALASTGGVMRIRPGRNAEVLQTGCTVCHSVSSKGNVLVTGVNWDKNPIDSEAFDLLADGSAKVRRIVNDGRVFSFGALTPDGTRLLSNGIADTPPLPRGLLGPYASKFFDTKSGKEISVPSLTSRVSYALTPNFSPDGAHLAFNNRDLSAGHTLSALDYDGTSSPPTFDNLRTILENPDKVLAWPSFLPDSAALVFHEGDSFDTAKYQGGPLYADLRLVGLDGKNLNTLAQLNGYDAHGAFSLPYGEAEESHLNYEPSVLPVPVGGYYWVLFTSRRAYGNTIAPGGSVARGDDKWGKPVGNEDETPSPRKKIWLAPIDLDYAGKVDPSHPAIYLPGQELESGNMRAFAALEPCRASGGGCESAAECCTGFCRQTGRNADGPVLQCVAPPSNACSETDEACAVAADCCNSHELCINKRCATPTPDQPPIH